jgi:GT2 family glycosyltransferase
MRQTHRPLEIIVVDNGSTDDSRTVVREEFQNQPDVPVQLICRRENLGFCAANNLGIDAAKGDFIALFNNDAEADPQWIAALLSAFHERPDVGMAASKILVWEDPRRIDKAGHLIYFDGQNRGRGSGEIDRGQYDTMEEVSWPDGCAAMYRRSLFEQIGGLDEDFFAYADDAELGLRARIAGWNCLYVPTATVRHHRGATLGVRSLRRIELIERNRILLAAKLFPWSLLCLNGVFYAARLSAGLWAALKGKGEISHFPGWKDKLQVAMAMARAGIQALRLLPKILRKRRSISRLRKLSSLQILRLLWKYRISLRRLSQQSI